MSSSEKAGGALLAAICQTLIKECEEHNSEYHHRTPESLILEAKAALLACAEARPSTDKGPETKNDDALSRSETHADRDRLQSSAPTDGGLSATAPNLLTLPQVLPLTVVLYRDHGAKLADEKLAAIRQGDTVIVNGASELFFHQLRLRATEDPTLHEQIAVFWSKDGTTLERVSGLRVSDELRWPVGFLNELWEKETEIRAARQAAKDDPVCEHGTALDVHCCNCHTGFIFDMDHECPAPPRAEALPLAKCCGIAAPDRSGRTCDKPHGHDGDHWTYGGATLTWPRAEAPETALSSASPETLAQPTTVAVGEAPASRVSESVTPRLVPNGGDSGQLAFDRYRSESGHLRLVNTRTGLFLRADLEPMWVKWSDVRRLLEEINGRAAALDAAPSMTVEAEDQLRALCVSAGWEDEGSTLGLVAGVVEALQYERARNAALARSAPAERGGTP